MEKRSDRNDAEDFSEELEKVGMRDLTTESTLVLPERFNPTAQGLGACVPIGEKLRDQAPPLRSLDQARELLGVDRMAEYGHPKASFARIAQLWSVLLGVDVTPEKVALCMVAMKMSRYLTDKKWDTVVDMVAYAAALEMLNEVPA